MLIGKVIMIVPYPHQIMKAEEAIEVLREHMIVYLAMEERTGKTITAILTAEATGSTIKNVLVITKLVPKQDWVNVLNDLPKNKIYFVTNYHQAHKLTTHFDLVILDESHNYISAYPKTSKIHKDLTSITAGKPLIYVSATPHAQGPQQLFHQFKLSSWSPWANYKSFYRWFEDYGIPHTLPINGINVPQYTKVKVDKVLSEVKHLFVTGTRSEIGFEHEPEDQVHYVDLTEATKLTYNTLIADELVELSVGLLVCDTASKLRTSLHQLEGGTIKMGEHYFVLKNTEKVDYILEKFGDVKSLVIMYNYKAEKTKLEEVFKEALILQATSYAEGIDLSMYKDLVIYSQDFSTARHTQRRARQANMKRATPITVHFLLVKKGLSEQVYKTVSKNKKNFVDSVFKKDKLTTRGV
jgi:hypothetical protein